MTGEESATLISSGTELAYSLANRSVTCAYRSSTLQLS